MDPLDEFPEEHGGTAARLRARAEELEKAADACIAEAGEQEDAARRLRDRAERLREHMLQYRLATHAVEAEPGGYGLVAPDIHLGADEPEHAQQGDVWMKPDPVDPSTYRRHEYHPNFGWKRMAPMTGRP